MSPAVFPPSVLDPTYLSPSSQPFAPCLDPQWGGGQFVCRGSRREGNTDAGTHPSSLGRCSWEEADPPLNPPFARETFGVPEPGPAPCATRFPSRGCRALPPPIPGPIPTPALPGPDPGTRRWEGRSQTRASLIGRPLAPPAGRRGHRGRGRALRGAWPEQRWSWDPAVVLPERGKGGSDQSRGSLPAYGARAPPMATNSPSATHGWAEFLPGHLCGLSWSLNFSEPQHSQKQRGHNYCPSCPLHWKFPGDPCPEPLPARPQAHSLYWGPWSPVVG